MDAELSLNEIMEQIPEAFFALNREWEFIYANELACQLLSRDRETLLYKNVWTEFEEALGLRFEHQYRKAMEQQDSVQFEEYFEPLRKWFRVRAYPSSVGIYVYFQDITVSKNLDRELQRTNLIVAGAQKIAFFAVWEWDIQGDRVRWSYGAERFGLTQESVTVEYFIDHYVHADDKDTLRKAFRLALSGHSYDVEYRMITPTGEMLIIRSQGELSLGSLDSPSRMIGIAQNITKQRETEGLLQESQERHLSLEQFNPDGICRLNFNGEFLKANPALEKLLGYTETQLQAMSIFDFIIADDAGRFSTVLSKVSLRSTSSLKLECRMRRNDGHLMDVYCTTVPIVIKGEIRGLYIIIQNITDQKRSSETLQHAVRLAKLGHWDWDVKADKVFCSEYMQEILGLPAEQNALSYAGFMDFVHPSDRHWLNESVQQSFLKGTVFDYTFRIQHADNMCFVHSEGNVFLDDNRNPLRMVGTLQDITIQKRAEESLRESQALLQISDKLAVVGQLAAGVAHEIRNPLTSIKGFVQIMLKEPQANQRYLDVMEIEVNRMQDIISELLLLAKPQAVEYLTSNLQSLLDDVVSVMETQAIINKVTIETAFEHDLDVKCEPNHLKQVFINIIKNAIEAMPNGGRLSISAVHNVRSVQVQVTDDGEGIAEDKIDRLGDPFFTTKDTGTGLGLLISQRIISDHNGTITFDSKVGQGTTVTITLPRSRS